MIEPGQIYQRTLGGIQSLEYFVYRPTNPQQERILLTIHGISRNAEEHVRGFIPQAERYGATIIAPLFTKAAFPRYQRLGNSVHEGRADLAFDQILQDAANWLDMSIYPLRMFGFSGGGQFAHRYALFYPKHVERLVLTAPGWYTYPDADLYYPFGVRSAREWPKLKFSVERILGIPTLVLVGDEDDLRDPDLNKRRQIDATQGFNRIERGERWVNAMRAMARAFAIQADFRFETVPNANHAYESYLSHPPFSERIFSFLFDTAL